MNNRSFLGGIVGSATTVGPRSNQQDAVLHLVLPGAKVVIVADGIGSAQNSHIISTNAVVTAANVIQKSVLYERQAVIGTKTLQSAVRLAHEYCRHINQKLMAQGLEPGGTTLLIGMETADYYHVVAVGDGDISLVEGSGIPTTNLIVAKSIHEHIGSGSKSIRPEIMSYPKQSRYGYCLFVGSDGIATSILGHGNSVSPLPTEIQTLRFIYQGITQYLESATTPHGADVQRILETWVRGDVKALADGRELAQAHDNRSVGVIIDQEFIDHRMNRERSEKS